MTFATINSPRVKNLCAGLVAFVVVTFSLCAAETNVIKAATPVEKPIARAERIFLEARAKFRAATNTSDLNWQFGQAAFDWAEFATNDSQRAQIAEQAIAACRALIKRETNSVAGHYFLGMNLGQLARTKFLGALSIVDEMEREFKTSRALDEKFDYAGSDRNLGLLYRDAPSFGSIGDKSKARTHLKRALELAPGYLENRINLIEAYLQWGEKVAARKLYDALEASLPVARNEFSGPEWTQSWLDWRKRLTAVREKLGLPPKPLALPRPKTP